MMQKFLPWLSRAVVFAGLVLASGSQAATYSSLVVFGDSLSDSGNNALALGGGVNTPITDNSTILELPTTFGTYTNGSVWASRFAAAANLPLVPSLVPGGTNFSYGGAGVSGDRDVGGFTIPSLPTQLATYLQGTGNTASSSALYVIAGGGNDARDIAEAAAQGVDPTSAIQTYAANMASMVGLLQSKGAEHIVVWNVPNIGRTPVAFELGATAVLGGSALANEMNNALSFALGSLPSMAGVQIFDIYGLTARAQASGQFPNTTDACGSLQTGCAGVLFYDGIHPTTAGHAMIAGEMLTLTAAVPEPAEYAMFFAGLLVIGAVVRRQRRS